MLLAPCSLPVVVCGWVSLVMLFGGERFLGLEFGNKNFIRYSVAGDSNSSWMGMFFVVGRLTCIF